MILVRCSNDETARGNAPALTFAQAAEIVRTEPPAQRGSAPGLPVIYPGTEPEPVEREPRQQSLL